MASAAPAQGQPSASPPPPPSPPPALVTTVANGNNHSSKVDLQVLYQAVITGLTAFYQPTDVFQMKSGIMTRDELISQFLAFVTAAEKAKSSNQNWRTDVQNERTLELTVAPLRAGVRGIAEARFGKDGTQLLQFGFTPRKVAARTAVEKAAAAAKAKATRVARGTVGKKKKLAIKGTVPVAATTPAPAASSPTPAPSPVTVVVTQAAPAPSTAPATVAVTPVAPATPASPSH